MRGARYLIILSEIGQSSIIMAYSSQLCKASAVLVVSEGRIIGLEIATSQACRGQSRAEHLLND